jgi:hypothetical protein
MVRVVQDERRRTAEPVPADRRGALWSLPGGQRLPNSLEGPPVAVGDPDHPARLRPTDLENPEGFHLRLTAWLLQQG